MRRFLIRNAAGEQVGEGVEWTDGHVDTTGPGHYPDSASAGKWLAADGQTIHWLDREPGAFGTLSLEWNSHLWVRRTEQVEGEPGVSRYVDGPGLCSRCGMPMPKLTDPTPPMCPA